MTALVKNRMPAIYLKRERYRKNMLDWQKFFRVLNKEAEGVEDIINGLEFIKNNYDWGNDGANVGGMVGDYNPSWIIEEEARYREQRGSESEKTKQIKRSIVCGHPLEWDRELYLEGGSIRPGIATSYGTWLSRGDQEYFKEKVEAIDIWEGLKNKRIDGLDTSKNNFWFAHPIYFMNHLKKAGLLEREMLIRVQDRVLELKCLDPNGGAGIYGNQLGETFCNHAVFLTIIATDANYVSFTGRINPNPANYRNYPFPEYYTKKERDEYVRVHSIKSSNYWCDELEKFKDEGKLIELSPPDAQEYGNMGYTVLGAYRANKDRRERSPHFATVRPGFEVNPTFGPKVLNIGENNLIEWAGKETCFGEKRYNYTKWYYNPNQDFRLDMRWINYLK
ncbi:MAG: hypothetical protein FWG99_11905 [Treponema sp.]|nr:hypothetical protein [Treponema sp.]